MAASPDQSTTNSLLQPPKPRRSTNYVLPTLRLLFRPKAGLGLDARMPFNKQIRWYMSLESYFCGTSAVRFGIESTRFPFLRMQCAPEVRLSIRLPLLQISEFNRFYLGSQLTLVSDGQGPKLNFNGLTSFYDGFKPFLKPICELQRHASIGGLLLSDKQRRALREALEKAKTKRDAQANELLKRRDQLLRSQDDKLEHDHVEKARIIKEFKEKLQGSWNDRPLNRELTPPARNEHSRPGDMKPIKRPKQFNEEDDKDSPTTRKSSTKSGAFVFAVLSD